MSYNEQIIQFSKRRGLVGVVSMPGSNNNPDKKPAVLILNAGLVHRVGPYRMHTVLARRLAEMGHLVFRFDLSNIGDSQNSNADLPYREQTIQDVKAAMDSSKTYYVEVTVGAGEVLVSSHPLQVEAFRVALSELAKAGDDVGGPEDAWRAFATACVGVEREVAELVS